MKSDTYTAEIAKLRREIEEYAKQFPTIGFEKETMKYKNWQLIFIVLPVVGMFHPAILTDDSV